MYDLAIDHFPYKLPLTTIATLVVFLVGLHLLGLIKVELGTFHPRLLLIFGLYLLVLAAIIWIHKLITVKLKAQLTGNQQISIE
jgi:hypothetical protein